MGIFNFTNDSIYNPLLKDKNLINKEYIINYYKNFDILDFGAESKISKFL
jgi:hypothetical protein